MRYRNVIKLVFSAVRDIRPGEELLFDYGHEGLTPETLVATPWLIDQLELVRYIQ